MEKAARRSDCALEWVWAVSMLNPALYQYAYHDYNHNTHLTEIKSSLLHIKGPNGQGYPVTWSGQDKNLHLWYYEH